jgi:hypothetical protein
MRVSPEADVSVLALELAQAASPADAATRRDRIATARNIEREIAAFTIRMSAAPFLVSAARPERG